MVMGRPDLGVFLAVPPEAVTLLDLLAQGKTVGEAQDAYRERYGETPDLPDFLTLLEKRGFVQPSNLLTASPMDEARKREAKRPMPRNHFENIPFSTAKKIFSLPSLAGAGIIVVLALIAATLDPSIIPGRGALFFQDHRFFYALALVIIGCSAVFIHEIGHLIAARALGVSSRFTIGHRLWVVVAETDLTGLWSVPKEDRYLPMLAGPLIDIVSTSVLLLFIFARNASWLHLGPVASRLLPAVIFGYLMRITWQFFFFVRTDFYYVIANFFGCKNLLKDTEAFLSNTLARFIPGRGQVDQSAISPSEMRVIRVYSIVWLLGRGVAFAVLFLVTLPLTVKYAFSVNTTFHAGLHENTYPFLDSLAFTALSLAPLIAGLTLWIRSLLRGWRTKP